MTPIPNFRPGRLEELQKWIDCVLQDVPTNVKDALEEMHTLEISAEQLCRIKQFRKEDGT